MWTFIILTFGVIFSLYNLKKSLQERKHPRKKQCKKHTISHDLQERDESEITEEQMIDEDYYHNQGKN